MIRDPQQESIPEPDDPAGRLDLSSKKIKPECRVLMVFAVLGVGGAETWLMAVLRHFEKIKDQLPVRLKIDICLTGGMRGTFDDEAVSLGARLSFLPYTRKNLPRFVSQFRRLLSKGRYHAIHDHQDYTAGLHFLFGVGLLPPVRVVHLHNTAANLAYLSSTYVRRLTLQAGKQLVGKFATHVTGTSRQLLTEYGFDDPAFSHIPRGALHCGFDTARYLGDRRRLHQEVCREMGWTEDVKIILFAGRLSSNFNVKNPGFAIDVANACLAKRNDVRLIMAGGGEAVTQSLKVKVEELGLAEHVRLVGERDDLARLMLGSNLFLFPSLSEGLGMVAVEAQAAGLPVLASNTIPRECVVLNELVRFVSLSEDLSVWVEHAEWLLDTPHPNSAHCNSAVRDSAFSIENSAGRLLNLYTSALRDSLSP